MVQLSRVDRKYAQELDSRDELASLIPHFSVGHANDPQREIYLDGNSLGLPSDRTYETMNELMAQWSNGKIRGWNEGWLDLDARIGNYVAENFLGAGVGEVIVSDNTTINLFKLAVAILLYYRNQSQPNRNILLTNEGNFPTDVHVLEGLQNLLGAELHLFQSDPIYGPNVESVQAALDKFPDRAALVVVSRVDYRSGALIDMKAITQAVHKAGAKVLEDDCHSVVFVPNNLHESGVDGMVSCMYKGANGGPGSSAILYVRKDFQDVLFNPIQGWFGQDPERQFMFDTHYTPAKGIRRFLTGTPNILSLAAIKGSVELLATAGVEKLRKKGVALTEYMLQLYDSLLAQSGLQLATPRESSKRGIHLSLQHPDAWGISKALIYNKVVPDHRPPDIVRFGLVPAYIRFIDVYDAMLKLKNIMETEQYMNNFRRDVVP